MTTDKQLRAAYDKGFLDGMKAAEERARKKFADEVRLLLLDEHRAGYREGFRMGFGDGRVYEMQYGQLKSEYQPPINL